MPPFTAGTASMRAAFAAGEKIKAAEISRLKSAKEHRSWTKLERKYQASGGHSGMSVFVDLKAGHFEVGSLIDEPAILCAQQEMF
jgi:hypothetical protein